VNISEKNLEDFLPKKDAHFYKKFETKIIAKQISKNEIVEKIKTVYDPEIPVNLYDLGLIYEVNNDEKNNVVIEMTLTNPNCPVAGTMPENVGKSIEKLTNLNSIEVSLVWQPKWNKDLMSDEAKLALDIF